jgi:energy-coupling factor transporter ATP-binding protein EcfA2
VSHVLLTEGLRFSYGAVHPVLVDLNMRAEEGEGVALMGPNGAGKSTVLRLAMALHRPVAGYMISAGRDTRKVLPEQIATQVGFMFQQPDDQLFAPTVRAELAFGPRQFRWSNAEITHRLDQVLPRLGLEHVADHHPFDLPLPLRKLVTLGCALMGRPALLLLDEPSAGMDAGSRARLIRVVREEVAAGVGVVAVTHDATFALEALDRAFVLDGGMVRRQGTVLDVLRSGDPALPALPATVRVLDELGVAIASPRRADMAAALAAHVGAAIAE